MNELQYPVGIRDDNFLLLRCIQGCMLYESCVRSPTPMTGIIFLCGLIILYYLFKSFYQSNSQTNSTQQQQKEEKQNYSTNALALLNILHFPSNKARITISIENVVHLAYAYFLFLLTSSLLFWTGFGQRNEES